jgi:hypothetical protein
MLRRIAPRTPAEKNRAQILKGGTAGYPFTHVMYVQHAWNVGRPWNRTSIAWRISLSRSAMA